MGRAFLPWNTWDLLFVVAVCFFAYFALDGIMTISASGILIDSDLQTYAQGMAGAASPEYFSRDPVLHSRNAANSIWNLQRYLAEILTPHGEYGVGLLRAGAVTLVLFLLGWYCFGRWLFRRRDAALFLSLVVSITVWVGCGTFWGVMHSDPVPRVLHAAFFPWMLMLAIMAFEEEMLRPFAMLCAGLGMWLHGVSALNCGAMFFLAFLFHRPRGISLGRHSFFLLLSLIAFFLPVLIFLWPSLFQGRTFSAEELSVFRDLFSLRWREDYGNVPREIADFLSPSSSHAVLLYAGLLSAILLWRFGDGYVRSFARMVPSCILALFCVVLFSLLESRYATEVGRVPMGHELVRGIKFLVPIAWICVSSLLLVLSQRFFRPLMPLLSATALLVVCFFASDRQIMAAQYAFHERTGLSLPLVPAAEKKKMEAESMREALREVANRVQPEEAVFSLEDCMMSVRYVAKRSLVYSFKDGYVHFYNKDIESCRAWLRYARSVENSADGIRDVIRETNAEWYLGSKKALVFFPGLETVWENGQWVLSRIK